MCSLARFRDDVQKVGRNVADRPDVVARMSRALGRFLALVRARQQLGRSASRQTGETGVVSVRSAAHDADSVHGRALLPPCGRLEFARDPLDGRRVHIVNLFLQVFLQLLAGTQVTVGARTKIRLDLTG